jgi:tRNA (guanine37-N1)-methyltransferase
LKKHLKTLLSEILPPTEAACIYNSYDIIGDIAIIRLTEKSAKHSNNIAQAIMTVHKNVKTVLAQTSAVDGEYRLRKMKHVAGEDKTRTAHKESGCLFSVDVEKCYFSPRLSHERMRIAQQVRDGEVVVNMFAGVGCFSVLIAKHANIKKVYSIDVNPVAVGYMRENIRTNGVFGKVVPILGDAKEVIGGKLRHAADRVLMPLPEKALEYLPYALLALKKNGGCIHYYDFEHANKDEDPVEKVKLRLADRLQSLSAVFQISFARIVRATGPNWYQTVLDIRIKSKKKDAGIQEEKQI